MQTIVPPRATHTAQGLHYCVISHTHWDREWYQPFDAFRLRLVDLIDNVLEILAQRPAYRFHLDAQTIVLEDYLELRPRRRADLAAHIASGRLLVGPWYVQNDFYLTSGEATVRNLLIGTALAEEFGHCTRTGYVPDQFGLIGQLPQIFQGFGISDCLFGRGYQRYERDAAGAAHPRRTANEFEWRGSDGSAVLAVHMSAWYNNAQRFPREGDRALKYLRIIEERIKGRSTTPYLLLMNGVDHLEAQEDLLPILDEINARLNGSGARIEQATMPEYFAQLQAALAGRALDVHQGELRSGPDHSILQGTLSSRLYLKRENMRAQSLLENRIEPLYALVGMLLGAEVYPADTLHYLWRQLIQNHPHDSICGCSCDPVHASMEDRFARLRIAAQDVLRRGLATLSQRVDRQALSPDSYLLTLCNTVQAARAEAVTAVLQFPESEHIARCELLTPEGQPVPFEVVESRPRLISLISPINLPGQMQVQEVTIRFAPQPLDGLAYRHYVVRPCARGGQPTANKSTRPRRCGTVATLENERLRVLVYSSGKVDLLDKVRGHWLHDLLALEDEADLGHSYNFAREPEGQPVAVSDWPARVELLEATPLRQCVRIRYQGRLSECYDRQRKQRSPRKQTNRVTLTLSLVQGGQWLELEAEVENRSRDHRLRLLLRTDLATDHSLSSVPFDLQTRDRREILEGVREDGSQPNSGLVWVHDDAHGLAVFNEGLYEFEHLLDARHSLAITLLRATGVIHHDALGANQGQQMLEPPSEWVAPANQSLRTTCFRLGVMPTAAAEADALALPSQALAFLNPPLLHFDAVDARKFLGGRPCVQDSEVDGIFYRDLPHGAAMLPAAAQPLRIEGEGIVLSALKLAENGEGWIVRVYNPWSATRDAELLLPSTARSACLLRLDEGEPRPLPLHGSRVRLTLRPRQICTVGFA